MKTKRRRRNHKPGTTDTVAGDALQTATGAGAADTADAADAAAVSMPETARPGGPDAQRSSTPTVAQLDDAAAEQGKAKFRLLRDPRWPLAVCVLVAFDAAMLLALTIPERVSFDAWLIAMVLVISAAIGSYSYRNSLDIFDGLRYLILTATVVLPLAAFGMPAVYIVTYIFAVIIGLLASRAAGVMVVRGLRYAWPAPVVIGGVGATGQRLARILNERPAYGLAPVAYLSDGPEDNLDLPLYDISEAGRVMDSLGATHLIVAYGPASTPRLLGAIARAHMDNRRVWHIPRLFDLSPARDHIWGIPVSPLPAPPLYNPVRRGVKRFIELVVTTLAIVVFSPLMAAIALAIKIDDRGPVIYRQKRLGPNDAEFEMLKFRTMHVGSDTVTDWTTHDDPRCTRVGRLLRRTSFDELPQLFNVLRGDMSLVGPRPELRKHALEFSGEFPGYDERLRVAGGITGLSQVNDLRGDTSIEDRVRFDNRYINRQSLLMDVAVMFQTIGSFFTSKSAR